MVLWCCVVTVVVVTVEVNLMPSPTKHRETRLARDQDRTAETHGQVSIISGSLQHHLVVLSGIRDRLHRGSLRTSPLPPVS